MLHLPEGDYGIRTLQQRKSIPDILVVAKILTLFQPPPYKGKADPKKCPLWDSSVEGRHTDEVSSCVAGYGCPR